MDGGGHSLFEQLERLVDGHVDAAVLIDADRRVLHYNLAWEVLTGRSGRELAARVEAGAECHQLFALEVCERACVGCGAHRDGRRRPSSRSIGVALTIMVRASPSPRVAPTSSTRRRRPSR